MQRTLRIAGVTAVIAALLGAVSDNYLMVAAGVPGSMVDGWPFIKELMRRVPHDRLLVGHYLGTLAIPWSALGFWHVWYGFRPAGRWAHLFLLAGLFTIMLGVTYHGQLAYVGQSLAAAEAASLPELAANIESYILVFQHILTVSFSVVAVLFLYIILTKPTLYPRWFAALTPACVGGIFYLLSMVLPGTLGVRLGVATPNLAMAVCFAASTALLWNAATPSSQ